MAYETKDNTGSLFKNTRREADSHPQATGSAVIDGKAYWVSAWTKKDKNGNPWQSLAFKPKDDAPARKEAADKVRDGGYAKAIDDEIPF